MASPSFKAIKYNFIFPMIIFKLKPILKLITNDQINGEKEILLKKKSNIINKIK